MSNAQKVKLIAYRPEIDGLRAVAVMSVILFHADFHHVRGGFLGVDIFFVISGYLITTIIVNDIEKDEFSIVRFYERRARRILPALFLTLLICVILAYYVMVPSQLLSFSNSLIGVGLFVSNIIFWSQSGYFDEASAEKPLLHTWSLSVEEQFYLLFPLLLISLRRFSAKKIYMYIIIALLTLSSFILFEWGWRNKPGATFYFTPTRAWEILVGSIVALILQKRNYQKNEIISVSGILLITIPMLVFDEKTPKTYSIIPILGALLVIFYGIKSRITHLILANKLMIYLGRISYSTYLLHHPIFAYAKLYQIEIESTWVRLCLILICILASSVIYHFVEQPFRYSQKINRKFILYFSSIGISMTIAIGLLGYLTDGTKYRFTKLLAGDVGHTQYYEFIENNYLNCRPKHIAQKALKYKDFTRCKQSMPGDPDIILLGDSHAEHLFIGLAEEFHDINVAYYILASKPYYNQIEFKEIFHTLSLMDSKKTVILTMHYIEALKNTNDLMIGFSSTVNFLKSLGHKVILTGDVPRFNVSAEDCAYQNSVTRAKNLCKLSMQEFDDQKQVYNEILTQISTQLNVSYIMINEPLCNSLECSMIFGDQLLYRDNNHLNIIGSSLIGKFLANKIWHLMDKN